MWRRGPRAGASPSSVSCGSPRSTWGSSSAPTTTCSSPSTASPTCTTGIDRIPWTAHVFVAPFNAPHCRLGAIAGRGRARAPTAAGRLRGAATARRRVHHNTRAEPPASRGPRSFVPGYHLAGPVPAVSERALDRRDGAGAGDDAGGPGSCSSADRRDGRGVRGGSRILAAHTRLAFSQRRVRRFRRRCGLVATSGALLSIDRRLGTLPIPSRPVSLREALAPPIAALSASAALAAIVILIDPQSVISYLRAHSALIVGAFGIAALSTALSTTAVLSVRRDVPG